MHEKIKATIFYYPKIKNQDKKKNICIQIKCIQEIEIIVPRKIAIYQCILPGPFFNSSDRFSFWGYMSFLSILCLFCYTCLKFLYCVFTL